MCQKYELKNALICPVLALKKMLKDRKIQNGQPLFQINTKKGVVPLIASNARSFLRTCIASMGLNPAHYTFHSFRRSGASLAFDSSVALRWFSPRVLDLARGRFLERS